MMHDMARLCESEMEVIMGEIFSDAEHVDPFMGCPCCTETSMDQLDGFDPGAGPFPHYPHEYVWCETCGTAYDPNHGRYVIGNSKLGI